MKYKILQHKTIKSYTFMRYEFACKHGLSMDDYEEVYTGEVEQDRPEAALEQLFMQFNCNRPEDFRGHSLSMSDIVELDGTKYYCDSFGWKEVK